MLFLLRHPVPALRCCLALSENGGATKLENLGIGEVDVVPLGVEIGDFEPARRDPQLRAKLGLADNEPLLIYVGRLDGEKKPDVAVDAFRKLPRELGAKLVLLGEGPLKAEIEALRDERIVMPGYVQNRGELARWLASADIYVSGMADETFGVSIVEAQASGLPVVGVAAGAMIDRVTDAVGRLGPVGDSHAMARNILDVWQSDRDAMANRARTEALRFSWDQHGAAVRPRLSNRIRATSRQCRCCARRRRSCRLTVQRAFT